MELNSILKPKIIGLLLLIGIVCLILAPIFGALLATITITEADPEKGYQKSISQDYNSMLLENAYKQEITLNQGEKCIVEFSCNYENSSVTIQFAGKGEYESEVSQNRSASSVTGERFMYSEFKINYNPDNDPTQIYTTSTSETITQDGFYYIEFMGDGDGNGIWSKPGDYVIIVYGSNSYFTTDPESDGVKFDIKVMLEGPGQLIEDILNFSGILVIAIASLLGMLYIINLIRFGGV